MTDLNGKPGMVPSIEPDIEPDIEPRFDDFLSQHRWAVLTHLRRNGGPVSSVVAYARYDGAFVVSTPGQTFKRRSISSDNRVNLCTLSNAEPFNFVALEGQAEVVTQDIVAATLRVFAAIEGTGYEAPADLPRWLAEQDRVILRIQPTRVYGVIR